MIVARKFDNIALALPHQLRRKYENVRRNAVPGCRQIMRRQAQPLEPVHDIGGEKYQLEEGNIGGPSMGGNFTQRVIVDKLPDVFLDSCPQAVESIHAQELSQLHLLGLKEAEFLEDDGFEFLVELGSDGGGCPYSRMELAQRIKQEQAIFA